MGRLNNGNRKTPMPAAEEQQYQDPPIPIQSTHAFYTKTEVEVEEPKIIKQVRVEPSVREKKDKVLSAIIDAKLETIDQVKLDASAMNLDQWSKVVARLHTERDVKVDANITAMGIFALFPVALQGEIE